MSAKTILYERVFSKLETWRFRFDRFKQWKFYAFRRSSVLCSRQFRSTCLAPQREFYYATGSLFSRKEGKRILLTGPDKRVTRGEGNVYLFIYFIYNRCLCAHYARIRIYNVVIVLYNKKMIIIKKKRFLIED